MPPIFRMPLGYGPSPGPRQTADGEPYRSPDVETLTAAVWARVAPERLAAILPEPFELDGDEVIVEVHRLRNIGWLGGRGYNIVDVKIPARIKTLEGELEGDYMSVLWENRADPIITGREELGFAKIYAEITDLPEADSGLVSAQASWDGFPFFELTVDQLDESKSIRGGRKRFHHKYVPATGDFGRSDVAYPVLTPPEDPYRKLEGSWVGNGAFAFHKADFQQLPTMDYIVNALAALNPLEFGHAQVTLARGVKNLDDQRRLQV